ncbi:hypothetical protein QJS10_CPB21g01142 [Acorus calamus]|uniref:Reverse transcriptase zinc-binding domain-containing protein n=1 Tax=Acorus calamus TaxID=4465 RepID=A0AAV9C4A3_ACOCL|nr:hypothetical protein QJS10_CPB21g01142 [Acorus calamus]
MESAIEWKVGNGASVHFWKDRWSGVEKLCDLVPDIYRLANKKEGTVGEFYQLEDGAWSIELSRARLTVDETRQFTVLLERLGLHNLHASEEDQYRWKFKRSGMHSVKSAYNRWSTEQAGGSRPSAKFAQTWRPKIPLKIKVFVWFLFLERLMTRAYRARWAPEDSTVCALCSGATETAEHLFCTCEVAREFWSLVGRFTGLQTTFHTVEELWAAGKAMKRANDNSMAAVVSQSIVPAGAWTIWKTRNEAIFKGTRVYQENMWDMFRGCMSDWGRHIARAGEVQFREGTICITG